MTINLSDEMVSTLQKGMLIAQREYLARAAAATKRGNKALATEYRELADDATDALSMLDAMTHPDDALELHEAEAKELRSELRYHERQIVKLRERRGTQS